MNLLIQVVCYYQPQLEAIFLVVFVTISCANGLTVDDFFESDATEMNVTTTATDYDLRIQISNFIGIKKPNTVTAITVFSGLRINFKYVIINLHFFQHIRFITMED